VGIIGRRIDIQPEEDVMSELTITAFPSSLAPVVFQPNPNVFYCLDAAAHLAGVSRRSLLIYCRARLIQPVFQPPYGMMSFTEEAIYRVRRIEHLRTVHRNDLAWLNTVCDLLNEVEHLRTQLRFFRNS
jgi:hypothetical protein